MKGKRTSKHSMVIHVGSESAIHCLFGDLMISSLICCSDRTSKFENSFLGLLILSLRLMT